VEDRPWSLLSKDSETVMGDSKCFHGFQRLEPTGISESGNMPTQNAGYIRSLRGESLGGRGRQECVSQGSNVVHRSEVTKAGSEARVGIFDDAHRVEHIEAASGRFSVGSLTRMPNRNN
jgi:hypothetical protein